MEINKINTMDFQQIFITVIETIIHIIRNRIHEVSRFKKKIYVTGLPKYQDKLVCLLFNCNTIKLN